MSLAVAWGAVWPHRSWLRVAGRGLVPVVVGSWFGSFSRAASDTLQLTATGAEPALLAGLVGVVVYLGVVYWRAGELAVIGQQRQPQRLGQRHVHAVVGGEIVPQLEHAGLQRLHRMTHDPQARVVGQHLTSPGGRDLPRRGDRQASHDAGDLGVDQGRSMDGAREALAQQVVALPAGQQPDDDRAVNDVGHRRPSLADDRNSSMV